MDEGDVKGQPDDKEREKRKKRGEKYGSEGRKDSPYDDDRLVSDPFYNAERNQRNSEEKEAHQVVPATTPCKKITP